MNSCVLMAKIISDPELRYTPDNQLPITQMVIEIDGLGPNDPPATLQAVGWGNLASEIKEKYFQGDQVILMGRLSMKNFDRPEGFKEKRAELILAQVYPLSASAVNIPRVMNPVDNVVPLDSFKPKQKTPEPMEELEMSKMSTDIDERETFKASPPPNDQDLDDIPF